MAFRSPLHDVEIPDLSVYDYLFGDLAPDDRDRIATIGGASGATTNCGTLLGQVHGVAGALAARGIGVGDIVALHFPDVPAFVLDGAPGHARKRPPRRADAAVLVGRDADGVLRESEVSA